MRSLPLLNSFQDRRWGLLGSLVFHGIFFLAGGALFIRPAQYGVESGTGGIEISLVAAPSQGGAAEADLATAGEPLSETEGEWATRKPKAVSAGPGKSAGDGSSAVPGNDPTTFYSAAGATSGGKPNYLKNPVPRYPWASLVRGEEGLVLLAVRVDKFGRPTKVELERSSGFPTLDESSLKTVRRWKFDPAHAGMLAVESKIKIPIRFVLKDQPFFEKPKDNSS